MRLGIWRRGMVRRANRASTAVKCIAVLFFCLVSSSGQESAAQESAKAFVQSLGDDVIAVIKNAKLDRQQRRAALHAVFREAFDAESTARFVLGRHWRTVSDAQKSEYLRLFPDYVADIYAGQFATYSGETFSTLQERRVGERQFLVNAEIRRPDKASLYVDFRVRRYDGVFRIVDVVVERFSLVITKRDEFGSVIGREGMDTLLLRMRRQVEGVPSKLSTRNLRGPA